MVPGTLVPENRCGLQALRLAKLAFTGADFIGVFGANVEIVHWANPGNARSRRNSKRLI
jgi:hypothetical protein